MSWRSKLQTRTASAIKDLKSWAVGWLSSLAILAAAACGPASAAPPTVVVEIPTSAAPATALPLPPTASEAASAAPAPPLSPTAAATSTAEPSSTPSAAPTATLEPSFTPSAAPTATLEPTVTPSAAADPVILAAGDIASCNSYGATATAVLIDSLPGSVLTLGDNAYQDGSAAQFANCYAPTWGRFKDRTYPTPGNHDYLTYGARGYYDYFATAAGDPAQGYYSFDLGGWHLIALNSNCTAVGGCQAGSPQELWLRADLAAHPAVCTLAFWHHPRFNAGFHGNDNRTQDLWQALYDAAADVILTGHDHNYQRFAPQDPTGQADPARGLREFVVGTGGASHYPVQPVFPNLEISNATTFGILRLDLHPASYDWNFIREGGKTFTDSGSSQCH